MREACARFVGLSEDFEKLERVKFLCDPGDDGDCYSRVLLHEPAMFQRNIKIRKATAAAVRFLLLSFFYFFNHYPQPIMRSVSPK